MAAALAGRARGLGLESRAPARPQPPARRRGGGGARARTRRPPTPGSPEAARAARSGAAARAPPPSASHPQAPLGPGPARSLAAEPSVSAPGGAYEAAHQLRPGRYWPPNPRPRAHWLTLTAPPLPPAGPINTSRPAPGRLDWVGTGAGLASPLASWPRHAGAHPRAG